jgi:multimeric flavodoxin WrbA
MGPVQIIGIAGSPRRGNTELLVKEALKAAEEIGHVETEFVTLVGKNIQPCKADYRCTTEGTFDLPCPTIPEDDVNDILKKIALVDGVIVGSPVYWGGVTAQLKALFDRSMAIESQNKALRNKIGGAISVAFDRNGGQETTILSIHWWMLINDMIVVGAGPEVPEIGQGGYIGGTAVQGFPYPKPSTTKEARSAAMEDKIGLNSVRSVGKRVAEVAKLLKSGLKEVPEEELAWPKKVKLELFDRYKELRKKK